MNQTQNLKKVKGNPGIVQTIQTCVITMHWNFEMNSPSVTQMSTLADGWAHKYISRTESCATKVILLSRNRKDQPKLTNWLGGPSTSSFIPHHLDQSGCAGVGAGYLNWFTCNPSQPPFRPLKGSMVQEGISSQPKQAPENISLQRKVTKGKIYILMPPSASIILCSICPTQLIMIPTKDD